MTLLETGQRRLDVVEFIDRVWLVTFMDYDLGYFEDETCRLEPIRIPSGQKYSPCLRYETYPMSSKRTFD